LRRFAEITDLDVKNKESLRRFLEFNKLMELKVISAYGDAENDP
jgi:hypothetical protein